MANLQKLNKSTIRKGEPPKEEEASNNLSVVKPEKTIENPKVKEDIKPLNFKIPNTFRKRFKNFATNNDMTMSDLLVLCFEEYEKSLKQ